MSLSLFGNCWRAKNSYWEMRLYWPRISWWGSNIILEISMVIVIVTISASLYRMIRTQSNQRNMIKPCIVSYKNHINGNCLVSYTIFVNLVSIKISKLKNIIMPAALSNTLSMSWEFVRLSKAYKSWNANYYLRLWIMVNE